MSVSAVASEPAGHDRSYHPLLIKRIVRETAEAVTIVFDVPPELVTAYRYEAGQFLTFKVTIGGQTLYRSYSMSSAPAVDAELAVTVKRVPGGRASGWMVDSLRPGHSIDASRPAGVFRLGPVERDVVAFAAGSGVTPIFSILKEALATSGRRVRLLYANPSEHAVIFNGELAELVAAHPDRLSVEHHLDCDTGYVTAASVTSYLDDARHAECYVCGPAPFMSLVEAALLEGGVPSDQIHIERFTVPEESESPTPPASNPATGTTEVTIELDGQVKSTTHHPGTTILQTARQMGFQPPFSCEAGNCATCMAKLVEGEVSMRVNDALFEDEVADGWILTCQSEPTTTTVRVVYGYEGS
jgi:ferredoxin-NADP reductase